MGVFRWSSVGMLRRRQAESSEYRIRRIVRLAYPTPADANLDTIRVRAMRITDR